MAKMFACRHSFVLPHTVCEEYITLPIPCRPVNNLTVIFLPPAIPRRFVEISTIDQLYPELTTVCSLPVSVTGRLELQLLISNLPLLVPGLDRARSASTSCRCFFRGTPVGSKSWNSPLLFPGCSLHAASARTTSSAAITSY